MVHLIPPGISQVHDVLQFPLRVLGSVLNKKIQTGKMVIPGDLCNLIHQRLIIAQPVIGIGIQWLDHNNGLTIGGGKKIQQCAKITELTVESKGNCAQCEFPSVDMDPVIAAVNAPPVVSR